MKYNIETLTKSQFIELIKNADDSYDNQIRVTKEGIIFISRTVGAENISGLKFRLETYDAGNGYVGPNAAADNAYIDDLYSNIMNAWKTNRTGYIDYWI